jgi:hypothetical protein
MQPKLINKNVKNTDKEEEKTLSTDFSKTEADVNVWGLLLVGFFKYM